MNSPVDNNCAKTKQLIIISNVFEIISIFITSEDYHFFTMNSLQKIHVHIIPICFFTALRILLIYFYFHLTDFIKIHCTYLNRSRAFVIALIKEKSCWHGERKKEFTVTWTSFDGFLKGDPHKANWPGQNLFWVTQNQWLYLYPPNKCSAGWLFGWGKCNEKLCPPPKYP